MRRIPWLAVPAILLLACARGGTETAAGPVVTDAGMEPTAEGRWRLAGDGELSLADGVLRLTQHGRQWTLADQVADLPAVAPAGDRLVYARRGEGVGLVTLEAWELGDGGDWLGPRAVADGDRPALSADGERVAFVSGRSGVASIWLVAFDGGESTQLTNAGVTSPALSPAPLDGPRHTPGEPPPGFVPPPVDGSLRFDGDTLRWRGPTGDHQVAVP